MKWTMILSACLMLAGCSEPLSQEQIKTTTLKCFEMGMHVEYRYEGWHNSPTKIVCTEYVPEGE